MFCVECGKEGKLYQSLCSDCFLKKNTFISIPKVIDVEICVHCGQRRKGKGWLIFQEQDMIRDVISENVKHPKNVTDFDLNLSSDFEDENNAVVKVETHAHVLGLKAPEEHETRIRIKKTVCRECSKLQGGYWEAKVQFRGSKRNLSQRDLDRALDLVDSIVKERGSKDKNSFISKIETMHGGLDFYVGSNSLGKIISKKLQLEFGAELKESQKLMGRKDGKDIYRMTYSVRVSDFRIGEFVELEGRVMKVLKLSPNRAILYVLDSGENISLGFEDIKSAKLLGGNEIVKDMVVVSKTESEIQVLDPDTLKTVDVLLPEGFGIAGEQVKVVKCDLGYFLVKVD